MTCTHTDILCDEALGLLIGLCMGKILARDFSSSSIQMLQPMNHLFKKDSNALSRAFR